MAFAFSCGWPSLAHGLELPGSAQDTSMHATGLRPRGTAAPLAFARCLVWPSPSPNRVGVPDDDCGAQYRACTSTCQRLTSPSPATAHDSVSRWIATTSRAEELPLLMSCRIRPGALGVPVLPTGSPHRSLFSLFSAGLTIPINNKRKQSTQDKKYHSHLNFILSWNYWHICRYSLTFLSTQSPQSKEEQEYRNYISQDFFSHFFGSTFAISIRSLATLFPTASETLLEGLPTPVIACKAPSIKLTIDSVFFMTAIPRGLVLIAASIKALGKGTGTPTISQSCP